MAIAGTPRLRELTPRVLTLILAFFAALLSIIPLPHHRLNEFLTNMEWASYDVRMRLRPVQPIDPKILLVGVTNLDHLLYGERLFTREAYQLALQALQRLKVRVVIFDLLFEYPRPKDSLIAFKFQELPTYLSYKFLSEPLPLDELADEIGFKDVAQFKRELQTLSSDEIKQAIEHLNEQKTELEQVRTEVEYRLDETKLEEIDAELFKIPFQLDLLAEAFLNRHYALDLPQSKNANPYRAKHVVLPSELLAINATGLGFINVEKGDEDVLRRIPLIYEHQERLYPHIDLVYICDYYGVGLQDLSIRFGDAIEFDPTRNAKGTKRIPIDLRGNMHVNFRESESFIERSYTLQSLIHYAKYRDQFPTKIKPSVFADSIVIIGENNVGGTDTQPIPLQPGFPMVGIHANVLHNILHDDYVFLLPSSSSRAIILGCALVLGLLFSFMDYKKSSLFLLAFALGYLIFCLVIFTSASVVLPIIRPLTAMLLGYIFIITYTIGVKEKDRRKVRNIFLKTVSPEIGEEILKQPDSEAIWGTKKRVTILFVDIRQFTGLSERLSADQIVQVLNAYYDTVSDIILKHGGQINKFMGDAVMALFGAPISGDADEARAIQAAVEIQRSTDRLNALTLMHELNVTLKTGVGINSGEVMVGTVGGAATRFEYTAIGDSVNIAERLQGIAAEDQILIGEQTFQQAVKTQSTVFESQGISFFKLPEVKLKGKTTSVDVYEVRYL